MTEKVTARFYVGSITSHGNFDQDTVTLLPAYSQGQNQQWAKATPSGKIELNVDSTLPAAEFFRNLLRDKDHNVAIEFSVVDKGE